MEDQVDRLVQKTWDKFQTTPASNRLLIAVAGIPGSGKTTFARAVASKLNDCYDAWQRATFPNARSTSPIALAVPLDGFHLTRKQLAAMPNAAEAIYRRGAAFTFDPTKYVALVNKVRAPLTATTPTIMAPSFDHAIKDPVEGDIPIRPTARILLFEGNYTALDRALWRDAAALMDELWFVDVPIEVATERLVKRHVAAGLSPDAAHARGRVLGSDMRNGHDIIDHLLPVQEVIESVDDGDFVPAPPPPAAGGIEHVVTDDTHHKETNGLEPQSLPTNSTEHVVVVDLNNEKTGFDLHFGSNGTTNRIQSVNGQWWSG